MLKSRLLCIFMLLYNIFANQVFMTVTTSQSQVGATANYTISINRARDVQGTTIIPSSISNPIKIKLAFDSSYTIQGGVTVLTYPFQLNTTQNSITLTIDSTLYNATNHLIIVQNIMNPFISGVALGINAFIMDSALTLYDESEKKLTFIPRVLVSDQVEWSFSPGTVSTLSNLSMAITTTIWEQNMYMQINFLKYWVRQLSNTSSSTIFSGTSSTCMPNCNILIGSSYTQVKFLSLSPTVTGDGKYETPISFRDIRSPPTLEPIDEISITIKEAASNTVVYESSDIFLSSTSTAPLEILTGATTNLINEAITLQIQFRTRNIFGPNDTITITLPDQAKLLPSTTNTTISLVSIFINSYKVQVQTVNVIRFSEFGMVASSYNNIQGTISIGGITSVTSSKPISNNAVVFRRYSYGYNEGTFSYSVGIRSLSGTITIDTNYANSNTNWLITINFVTKVVQTDKIRIQVPVAITVTSCAPSGGTCIITAPTEAVPYAYLDIFGFSSELTSMSVTGAVKNPISSGEQISVCSLDNENYEKECGDISYPQIQEASLQAQTLSLTMENSRVYGTGKFTILYNLTQYNLQNGFLITTLPSLVTLLNPTNIVCTVNGQTACTVTVSGNIVINTTVLSSQKIYSIEISNIRNPKSTQQFTILGRIAYTNNEFYYQISSSYYQATLPYTLVEDSNFVIESETSCVNNALNNITLSFISLPFSFTPQFDDQYLVYETINMKTGVKKDYLYSIVGATVSNTKLVLSIRNWYSYEQIPYSLTLYTSDRLYQIFTLTFTRQNCAPSALILSEYYFTGLPQDSASLNILYNRIYTNVTNYQIQIIFPNQYPQSIQISSNTSNTVTKASPRAFRILVPSTMQPVFLKMWGFTNVLSSSFFRVSIYDGTYLISSNDNTVFYDLTKITNCAFPCKQCVAGDGSNDGQCIQCYSSALTTKYLLNQETQRCVSICPAGTYPNNAQSLCQICPIECSACINTTYCTACSQFYYFLDNSCWTDCPDTYYPVDADQTCKTCQHPCNNCVSSAQCLDCASGFIFHQGKCLQQCATNYIAISQVCQKCVRPCSQCSPTTTTCLSCILPYSLYQNTCIQQCPSLYVSVSQQCIQCVSPCYSCAVQPTTCISCISTHNLYTSTCVIDCPVSYFSSATADGSKICVKCPELCAICTSNSSCQECHDSYYLFSEVCYQSCPIKMFPDPDNVCKDCQTGCLKCLNASFCQSCESGMFLVENICISQCPNATYPSGSSCLPCSEGCFNCTSDALCMSCTQAYTLYLSKCIDACPVNRTEVNNICVLCNTLISNCLECDPTQCSKCENGFYLYEESTTPQQICLIECPIGWIEYTTSAGIDSCRTCATGCKSCDIVYTNCSACQTGYIFYSNTCVTSCPMPLIQVNYQCMACLQPCATCSISTTNCTSCISPLYILGNSCFTQCPQNRYYQSNSAMKCESCQAGCLKCTENGCITCETGLFLIALPQSQQKQFNITLYECYESCPSHLSFIINDKFCSECSEHCLQCTGQNCLQCEIGYNRYGIYCVPLCPSPLIIYNQQCIDPPEQDNQTTPIDDKNDTNNDSTIDNNTNNTTVDPPIEPVPTGAQIPLPFTIVFGVLLITAVGSKIQSTKTIFSMCILASCAFLSPICNIVYLLKILLANTNEQLLTPLFILAASIGINYFINILHLIFSVATYRRDQRFNEYKNRHKCSNLVIALISFVTSHYCFVLYFCRLFNLGVFGAFLENLVCLKCINYIWIIGKLASLGAVIASILLIVTDTTYLVDSVDILIINAILLIFSLVLVRKTSQIWQVLTQQPDEDDRTGYSGKKVIFEQDQSQQRIGVDAQTYEEIHDKLSTKLIIGQKTNNRVANLFDNEDPQEDAAGPDDKEAVYFADENASDSTDPIKIQPSIDMKITAEEMKQGSVVFSQKDNTEGLNESIGGDRTQILNRQKSIHKSNLSPRNIFSQSEIEEERDSKISSPNKMMNSKFSHRSLGSKQLHASLFKQSSSQKYDDKRSNIAASGLKNNGRSSMQNFSKVSSPLGSYNMAASVYEEEGQEQEKNRSEGKSPDLDRYVNESMELEKKESQKSLSSRGSSKRLVRKKFNESKLDVHEVIQEQEEHEESNVREIQKQDKNQNEEKIKEQKQISKMLECKENEADDESEKEGVLKAEQRMPPQDIDDLDDGSEIISKKSSHHKMLKSSLSPSKKEIGEPSYIKQSPRMAPYTFTTSKSKRSISHLSSKNIKKLGDTIFVQSDNEDQITKKNPDLDKEEIQNNQTIANHELQAQVEKVAQEKQEQYQVQEHHKTIAQPSVSPKKQIKIKSNGFSIPKNGKSVSPRKDRSSISKPMKLFKSKNVSMEKRPSTSAVQFGGREKVPNFKDPKSLMRQIERKEKAKKQRQSLTNIYMKR